MTRTNDGADGAAEAAPLQVWLAGCRCVVFRMVQRALLTVFLELVVQRLEADAENFSRARLVVVRGFKGLQDQQAFGLIDSGADTEMDRIGIVHWRSRDGLPKSWWKVLSLDVRTRANNHRTFECVAQLTHIPRPGMRLKRGHDGFINAKDRTVVTLVHRSHD